ncbi:MULTISPECIES: winged helix-turn-helix transcriptional regulator [Chryseobacterium]|uniref:DNA-binding HxlR family transcriptional regulator n=1 Tax=Chryseobacterium camelliae TaxID=1265445 RepID=A0ABU0TIM5_9FLAO|nr:MULTISPECIES: helix-turn-helix domain-containing protein [Chryseobacterium]MDT3409223.1 DNA-binding HxlR family transcriptional regulator [Pseudacidovorax intermedius]MDQ1096915.1 DNA-binding HxlR family transcriptional regulator [Chryseobacterium camelliae]MDQ1100857.1 DNA-binding HxlR family transcriptional regulator [Chryseobacterium sp. SORGH_AS_1048]MDR6084299.1 DNA-binding HxlR family transcriptional regulator [Chryseobacterium sp. SORGH_AS_0909]MDR6132570.1 DNA-binding HxlR family tr
MQTENTDPSYPPFDECLKKVRAIDDTMELLAGKWKLSILARLCYKPMRYSEILNDIEPLSGKVLSRELKDLEINGLINRHVSDTKPPAVTYSVSDYGMSLRELSDKIAEWGLLHRDRIRSSFKKNEAGK